MVLEFFDAPTSESDLSSSCSSCSSSSSFFLSRFEAAAAAASWPWLRISRLPRASSPAWGAAARSLTASHQKQRGKSVLHSPSASTADVQKSRKLSRMRIGVERGQVHVEPEPKEEQSIRAALPTNSSDVEPAESLEPKDIAKSSPREARKVMAFRSHAASSLKALPASEIAGPSRIPFSPSHSRRASTATNTSAGATPQSQRPPKPLDAAQIAEQEAQKQRRRRHTTLSHLSELGSQQTRVTAWHPEHTRTAPPSARQVTVSHLLAATAHIGHSMGRVTRAYQPWIYGSRHGIAQIDVEHATMPALRRASKVVRDIVANDGVVLIVGSNVEIAPAVIAATRRMGPHGFHVTRERWQGGVLTNASKLLARAVLSSMEDYEQQYADSVGHRRNTPTSTAFASLHLKPDVVIILNPKANLHAIREATQSNIPTIAITDTDVDPRLVTYPIPANDESLRVQELIVGVLSKAGEEGWNVRRRAVEQWERKEAQEERQKRRARQLAEVDE